jgi:uncharacterized LabA/DUF88 family protein
MNKTACYVDGFNLYHAIDALGKDRLKWLNLMALAKYLLVDDDNLVSVVYFTAYMVWDKSKYERHKEYIKALESLGVSPVISKFQKSKKYCSTYARNCNFQEEKQTDVALSTRMICDCILKNLKKVILITADSDQVPTILALKAINPEIEIILFCPPQRLSIARQLKEISNSHREITEGILERCLLPRNVLNSSGDIVAKCPSKYQKM